MGSNPSRGKGPDEDKPQPKEETKTDKIPAVKERKYDVDDGIFVGNKQESFEPRERKTEVQIEDANDNWNRYVSENESEYFRGIRRKPPQGKQAEVVYNRTNTLGVAVNESKPHRPSGENSIRDENRSVHSDVNKTPEISPRNTVGQSRTMTKYLNPHRPELTVATKVDPIIFNHNHGGYVRMPLPKPERRQITNAHVHVTSERRHEQGVPKNDERRHEQDMPKNGETIYHSNQKPFYGHSEIIETRNKRTGQVILEERKLSTKPIFVSSQNPRGADVLFVHPSRTQNPYLQYRKVATTHQGVTVPQHAIPYQIPRGKQNNLHAPPRNNYRFWRAGTL